MYGAQHPHAKMSTPPTKNMKTPPSKVGSKPVSAKRPSMTGSDAGKAAKKQKKSPGGKKKNKSPQLTDRADRQKAAQTIAAVNAASGGKNDKAAALAGAILRGVTMRPSGKWVSVFGFVVMFAAEHFVYNLANILFVSLVYSFCQPTASTIVLCWKISIHWSL